jgi:hypothetical protein
MPPPMPRRSNRGLVIGLGLGGGMVVLVAAIGVLTLLLVGGTGGGGHSRGLAKSWTVPTPHLEDADKTIAAFPTVDRKTFVRVSLRGVTGYDMATGKARWTEGAPTGTTVCASTHSASDGVAAMLVGSDAACTTVVAFSIATGRTQWIATPHVIDRSDPPDSGALTVLGGRIYVTNFERLVSYDAKAGPDGKGVAKPVEEVDPGGCGFHGITAGTHRLASILECDDRTYAIGLNPKTLRRTFRTRLHLEPDQIVSVVNVDPLVLHASNALDNGELRFFDDSERQTNVFSSRQPQGTLSIDESPLDGENDDNVDYFSVRVIGTTLVALVVPPDDDGEGKVAGIDVRTGRWMWTKPLGTTDNVQMTIGQDPKKVTVFAEGGPGLHPTHEKSPRLIDFDPAGRTVTNGSMLDIGDDIPSFYFAAVFAVDKRVLVVQSDADGLDPIITAYG